jgi:uracil-DNA glycosylase family 4
MKCERCNLYKFKHGEGFTPYLQINNKCSKKGFIAFISDYPDTTEEICKTKFLTAHGKLLLNLLKKSFLFKYNWIFSSCVLCVPRMTIQEKRDPTKDELNICFNNTIKFLEDKEISYYVLIGKFAQSQFKTFKPNCNLIKSEVVLFAGGTSSSEYLYNLQKLNEVRSYLHG